MESRERDCWDSGITCCPQGMLLFHACELLLFPWHLSLVTHTKGQATVVSILLTGDTNEALASQPSQDSVTEEDNVPLQPLESR